MTPAGITILLLLIGWIGFMIVCAWRARVRGDRAVRVSEPLPADVAPVPSLVKSGSLFDGISEAKPVPPRKVSRITPNLANVIEDLKLGEQFPELVHPHLWITGSRVWRRVLGEWAHASADIDVFATTPEAYTALVDALVKRGGTMTPRPAENRSHARGYGCRIDPPPLADGSPGVAFDVWHETTDPMWQLQIYPSDGYGHCRAAFNLLNRTLIIRANEHAAFVPESMLAKLARK